MVLFFGAITKQIVYENKLKLQLIRGNTHAGIFNSADDGRRLEALMASDGIYWIEVATEVYEGLLSKLILVFGLA